MRIISWNLNGLLSCINNHAFDAIAEFDPDVICLQEIRTRQEPLVLPGYLHLWNHCERDGYSGTALLLKTSPISVVKGFGCEPDAEGRLLTVEYSDFFIVNAYTPNSQQNLQRHAFRMEWDEKFHRFVCALREDKPVIVCGDFNVARCELDIYEENMRQFWAQQGYASDERSNLETFIDEGFVDVFRHFNPDKRSYTWWSNRCNKRKDNRGWRLDYFFVSEDLLEEVLRIEHLQDILGSDHCPVLMEVAL